MDEYFARIMHLIRQNLKTPGAPLSGIATFPDNPRIFNAVFPYVMGLQGIAKRIQAATGKAPSLNRECWKLQDLMTKIVRSLQRIGICDQIRRESWAAVWADGGPPPGETRVSYVQVHHPPETIRSLEIDLSIAIDSSIFYARVTADCIAKSLRHIINDKNDKLLRSPWPSFNDVLKIAERNPDSNLGRFFAGAPLEWFRILRRPPEPDKIGPSDRGIRDNMVHYGAYNSVQWVTDSKHPSISRLRTFQAHPSAFDRDLLADVANVIRGLLGFMDHASRFATASEGGMDFSDDEIDIFYILTFSEPIDFVSTVIPRLNADPFSTVVFMT